MTFSERTISFIATVLVSHGHGGHFEKQPRFSMKMRLSVTFVLLDTLIEEYKITGNLAFMRRTGYFSKWLGFENAVIPNGHKLCHSDTKYKLCIF
jgi:hypothetical protein